MEKGGSGDNQEGTGERIKKGWQPVRESHCRKKAKDEKVQRKWRMLLISDSLFGGLTFDPEFESGSWERGWELGTVRGGWIGEIKAVIQAEDLMRGREKMIICGGSNNMMWVRKWEAKETIWKVGMTSWIRLLREVMEEAVGRRIAVEVVIFPPRHGMDEGRHGLVRKWIWEMVWEWKGVVKVIEL